MDKYEIERRAHIVNVDLSKCRPSDSGFDEDCELVKDDMVKAKKVAQKFLDETLKLPQLDQKKVFQAAQAENDRLVSVNINMPVMNIVFSHKTGELSDFKLNYPHIFLKRESNHQEFYQGESKYESNNHSRAWEQIDLYDP